MCAAERHDPAGDVASVQRISAVLDALAASESALGVSELARRTGLPKSTAYRLLRALVTTRLIERDGAAYRLGLRLFELGQQVPRQRDLELLAAPVMADLREATRHTVHLAVLQGTEVVYINVLPGPNAPSLPTRIGGRFPAHATGVGKAILAFAPREAVEGVIAHGLTRHGPRTVTSPAMLTRELERVRARRVAYDLEEGQAGLACAASPVFGADGAVVAALSVSGWSGRMDFDRVSAAVYTAALGLSRTLRAERL